MSGTIERSRGRWREILPQLGIGPGFLVNRHGPCPLCGGRDRFRFDDKDGSGSYYCNRCGPGSGVLLIRKRNSWDHATACREIDKIIGNAAPKRAPSATAPAPESAIGRLAKIERALSEATSREIVERYLRGRGLGTIPGVLRGHAALPYFDEDKRLIGRYPAMLAPVIGPDGKLQSVHRTYIADVTPRKKLMAPVDTARGGAVRLFDAGNELGICEGIETAIAAHELFNVPTWATVSTAGMEGFIPPDGLHRLTIYADNDRNFAGQKAAYVLANRLVRTVPAVEVVIPERPDTDWLDELVASGAEVAA